ncbi:integrase catalytic subunit [Klebsiella pneumoniae]|uniref:Integrase catalytic subunit n=1 Tax=Klebsiella pneumoniae TaxID=573 RepID=A0A377XCA3_KLEPN|nr:integrase catalytic subunit [Klebsiella pneumoniae]
MWMDNGPELVSLTLAQWAEEHGVMLELSGAARQHRMPLSNDSTGRTAQKYWIFICSERCMKYGKLQSAGWLNITASTPMNPE